MSIGMQLERSEVKMSGYYNNWSVSDMDKYVKVPLSDEDARSLKSGDYVYLTGTIYTARMRRTRECRKFWTGEKHFL